MASLVSVVGLKIVTSSTSDAILILLVEVVKLKMLTSSSIQVKNLSLNYA